MNERKTEDLVVARLSKKRYYRNTDIVIEKQKSDNPRIQKLLSSASKRGPGIGRPEFIIQSKSHPNFILLVECKASTRRHKSLGLDKPAEYAVDGALWYASHLAKDFDVVAIGVSGQTEEELRISHYLHLRGAIGASEFDVGEDILSVEEYHKRYRESSAKFRQDYDTLIRYAKDLNEQLHVEKIPESARGLLISAILIALKNETFKTSYHASADGYELAANMLQTISSEIGRAGLSEPKRDILKHSFSFIATAPPLVKDREFFVHLIDEIDSNINEFVRTYDFYDMIGEFYIEFLRYANNEKGLGIVLTPSHVADLFAGLAGVNKNSTLLDNCCGTAGLLLAGMRAMIKDAKGDEGKKKSIKSAQIFGVEYQPNIYSLAVSNMILHDDGRTNITRGDCFTDLPATLNGVRPNVGMLNPPYKSTPTDKEELEFVYNNLEALEIGGTCVAIVPFTCATADSGNPLEWKRKIMQRHTVEAAMSMPTELFHNSRTTVVTCIMVFTAGKPHPKGKKTWFGYWRDDGFEKSKHRGRGDYKGTWDSVKARWLSAYHNREVIRDFSLMREVSAEDEWCAEAYMETDYSRITEADFIETLRRYAAFKVRYADEVGTA